MGDPVRLRQIFLNLLGNAIKFTEKGEVVFSILVVSEDAEHAALRFTVKDTGIGIETDKLEHIFSPFTQADGSMTRRYGGTGLGLSICRELVSMMGGALGVESTIGEGSSFWFTVKLQKCLTSPISSRPVELSQLAGTRVLVVDDNFTNRRLLETITTNCGMVPVCAADAGTALEEIQNATRANAPFSLLLVDCEMPEVDGYGLVEQCRELGLLGNAAVVMLSSLDSNGGPRCRELGIASYLIKPVSQNELLETVLASIGEKGSREKKEGGSLSAEAPASMRSLRILLAEDNVINQKVACRLLERAGHTRASGWHRFSRCGDSGGGSLRPHTDGRANARRGRL